MSIAFCGDILLSCGADGTMKKRSLQGFGGEQRGAADGGGRAAGAVARGPEASLLNLMHASGMRDTP